MAITYVATGGPIKATDLNQAYNILSRPAGQQETGAYQVSGNAYASGATSYCWINTLSNTVIVSVSIDTSISAPFNFASGQPVVGRISYTSTGVGSGFEVKGTSSGIATKCDVAGNYTAQF
jgi:hypothetical protein